MMKKVSKVSSKPIVDRLELSRKLVLGAVDLGLSLNDEQTKQLLDFLFLLVKWNAVYNLTSLRQPEIILTHHLLDSLAVVSALSKAKKVLDVGAGGGLPGIVLAIMCPDLSVSLIDIVHKKTAFLTQVKTELGLKNVTVYTGRVEQLSLEKEFDVIISRAFASLSDFVNLSKHVLTDEGCFIAMKGQLPEAEIANLISGWQVEQIEVIQVPFLDAHRHLLVIKRKS